MLALLRRHPVLAAAFLAASLAALAFLVWFLIGASRWERPVAEPIRPWMTVGYVAQSRGLDPREIDRLAGLPLPVNGRPFTLAEIARNRGVPVEEVIADVQEAVRSLRRATRGQDDPPPGSADPARE